MMDTGELLLALALMPLAGFIAGFLGRKFQRWYCKLDKPYCERVAALKERGRL